MFYSFWLNDWWLAVKQHLLCKIVQVFVDMETEKKQMHSEASFVDNSVVNESFDSIVWFVFRSEMDHWPSERVARGGLFHPPKVNYSQETRDLLRRKDSFVFVCLSICYWLCTNQLISFDDGTETVNSATQQDRVISRKWLTSAASQGAKSPDENHQVSVEHRFHAGTNGQATNSRSN